MNFAGMRSLDFQIYSKRQGAEGFYAEGMHIDGSRFQYLARVLIGLATAITVSIKVWTDLTVKATTKQ